MSIEPHTIEHLKSFVGLVIDEYHEGTAPDPAGAKLRIWQELQRCAGTSENIKIEGIPYWLRLESVDTNTIMDVLLMALEDFGEVHIAAFRWLGARHPEGNSVAWVVLDVKTPEAAFCVHKRLVEQGLNVRDGNLGGVTL